MLPLMRLFPKVVGKSSSSIDVFGIDTKDIIENGDPQEARSKIRITRTKIEEYVQEVEKQEASPLSSHDWITTRDHPLENVLRDIKMSLLDSFWHLLVALILNCTKWM